MKAAMEWVTRYTKGLTAAAGALLTILSAVYAGHTPHWLVWVIGLATALGVVAVPNKVKDPLESILSRVIRRELGLDQPAKPVPGPGGNAGGTP